MRSILLALIGIYLLSSCAKDYDVIIRNGTVYDGSGSAPIKTDIGIKGDRIDTLGNLTHFSAKKEIDAKGLAVAPGFINMLSWATNSLITDGKGQSDIRQGITLEVFGEGTSMGPISPKLQKEIEEKGDKVQWTTLGQYLEYLEKKGISPNVASFIGATTLRTYTVGYEDRPPTPQELDSMRLLTKQGMEEGALGIGSSLIYAPAFYAKTEELIEICKVLI